MVKNHYFESKDKFFLTIFHGKSGRIILIFLVRKLLYDFGVRRWPEEVLLIPLHFISLFACVLIDGYFSVVFLMIFFLR